MTIFQLECFCALADSLNFTQTANAMFITQPALSRAISSLEQELQLTLLQRTTHSVTLTPAGKIFSSECHKMLKEFQRGSERARSAQAGQIGSVRIGFQRDNFETYIVDFVNLFRRSHTDITLELLPLSVNELNNALQEKIADARRAKHDVRHHISLMQEYVRNKQYGELEKYLNSYQQSLPDDTLISFCENKTVNAVMLYFAQVAKNEDIDYDVKAVIPENISVDETDLSVLFGNLIENATDACREASRGVVSQGGRKAAITEE